MAKAKATEESKAVAKVAPGNAALPDYLRDQEKTVKVGNVDSTDRIIPRVKLLQGISPEVTEYDNAKAGQFWHSVASELLGTEIIGIPIILNKTYVLWAPRNDDRGILARASDGINWDTPDLEFTIKPKNYPHNVVHKLGKTVHDSVDGGIPLSEFGSSIPGDPNSAPAAALTYEMLWFFPEFPELSPAVIINTRSSVKPAKDLINKIDIRPVNHYYQQYRIGIAQEQSDDGPFYNYKYQPDGYASEEVAAITEAMFETFQKTSYRANDEQADADKGEGGGGSRGTKSNKADSDKY